MNEHWAHDRRAHWEDCVSGTSFSPDGEMGPEVTCPSHAVWSELCNCKVIGVSCLLPTGLVHLGRQNSGRQLSLHQAVHVRVGADFNSFCLRTYGFTLASS